MLLKRRKPKRRAPRLKTLPIKSGIIQQLQVDIRALCEGRARYDTDILPENVYFPFVSRLQDFMDRAVDELATAHDRAVGFRSLDLSPRDADTLDGLIKALATSHTLCSEFSDPDRAYRHTTPGYSFEVSLDYRLASLRDSLGELTKPLEAVEEFLEPYDTPPAMTRAERAALNDFGPS